MNLVVHPTVSKCLVLVTQNATQNHLFLWQFFCSFTSHDYHIHIIIHLFPYRSRLAKTKIDAGTENEKKDDSGNETGAGENEQEEDSDVVHYDKAKSFFDNISCEAVERSKGSV